jgi:hypothetical protein
MQSMFGHVVFAAGKTTYQWDDVVLAAQQWGDWGEFETEVRYGIACAKRMEESGERAAADAVQSAANAFRYDHNLLTAQETEAWLRAWGLTTASWMAYVERSMLRQRWAAERTELLSRYPASDAEIESLSTVEGVCSGHLRRFAQKLAGRASAHDKVTGGGDVAPDERARPEESPTMPAAREPLRDDRPCGVPGISPERCREILASLARLERSFELFRAETLTAKAVRECINSHHLDWIRLDCRSVTFTDEGAAREAALCLREDGGDLDSVAADARATPRDSRLYLSEIDVTIRDRFLRARAGEVLGPLRLDGAFVLYLVLQKVLPSEHDAEVRRLAEETVLRHAVAHEIHQRVHWHIPV